MFFFPQGIEQLKSCFISRCPTLLMTSRKRRCPAMPVRHPTIRKPSEEKRSWKDNKKKKRSGAKSSSLLFIFVSWNWKSMEFADLNHVFQESPGSGSFVNAWSALWQKGIQQERKQRELEAAEAERKQQQIEEAPVLHQNWKPLEIIPIETYWNPEWKHVSSCQLGRQIED